MASGSSLLHFLGLAFFLAVALPVLLGFAFFLAAALLLGLALFLAAALLLGFAFFLAAARVWSFGFVFGHASGIFGAGLRARVLAGVMRAGDRVSSWVGGISSSCSRFGVAGISSSKSSSFSSGIGGMAAFSEAVSKALAALTSLSHKPVLQAGSSSVVSPGP